MILKSLSSNFKIPFAKVVGGGEGVVGGGEGVLVAPQALNRS